MPGMRSADARIPANVVNPILAIQIGSILLFRAEKTAADSPRINLSPELDSYKLPAIPRFAASNPSPGNTNL